MSVRGIHFYAAAALLFPDRTGEGYRIFGLRALVVRDLIRSLRDQNQIAQLRRNPC